MKKCLLGFTLLIAIASCNEEASIGQPGDPSNLFIEISKTESNPGQVIIAATADNAESYQFDMGDNNVMTNASGNINHTYESTNLYTIEVRAYGESGRYVKKQSSVTIDLGSGDVGNGLTSPLSYEGFTLLWQDEFTGSGINGSNWTHELGDGCSKGICGWGNNELQYYRAENTTVSNGKLTITAKNEAIGGKQYTSSRLISQDKLEFKYGRIDIRAKMPEGQGMWPALWMLGANINDIGWPKCGEIDIMEMKGGGSGRDNTTHGTVHWDNDGQHSSHGGSRSLILGNLSDEFHVYSIIWTENSIQWEFDDKLYHTTSLTDSQKSEFKSEFFFVMNIAVGGNWPGNPDSNTQFPQEMNVDYIRVFQPN